MAQTIQAHTFGDCLVRDGAVTHAPPYTRIALNTLRRPEITVDGDHITICGHVDYQPIDLDPAGMTLICALTADRRPLMVQAADRAQQRTAGGAHGTRPHPM